MSSALTEAVEARRMLVVVVEGPGGVGKTALTLYWAHHNIACFPDGQLYADLRGFDPAGVPASVPSVLHGFLVAMGVEPGAIPFDIESATGLYRSLLSGKRVMVVLDNARDAAHVLPLLPGSPSCAVFVTSRQQLPGLVMRGALSMRLDMLSRDGARVFLAEHVGRMSLECDPQAVDTVLDCCGGLPLALAIVVARTSSHPEFPVSVLADELRGEAGGLNVFDAGDESANLSAVLSWSSSSLPAQEARAFRLLGAAPVREIGLAATASLLGVAAGEAARLLGALERKNLVRQHQPGRFRMHDLLRQHAVELSAAQDPLSARSAAMRRLVDFYLHTARAADHLLYPYRAPIDPPDLAEGCTPSRLADEAGALEWFTLEHQQVLATQRFALAEGWMEHAWQLSRVADTYHYRAGNLRDNVESSRMGATAADRLDVAAVRALAYRQLGRAHTRAGDLTEALACLEIALALTRETADAEGQAHTHHDLTRAYARAADHEQAVRHASAAFALYQTAGNPIGQAHALNAQARQHSDLADQDRAREACEASLALHVLHRNTSGQVAALETLGLVAERTGQHGEAIEHYERALALCRQIANRFAEAGLYEHLAQAQSAHGEYVRAAEALRSAHVLYSAQGRVLDAERVQGMLDRARSADSG